AGSAAPGTPSVPGGCVTSAGAPCPTAPARGCATAAGFSGSAAGRLREACPSPSAASTRSGADRYGYCSVAGNVDSNGTPLEPGSFLNLLLGQPDSDAHYTGATPAFFVTGVGVTCSLSDSQAAQAAGTNAKVNHT